MSSSARPFGVCGGRPCFGAASARPVRPSRCFAAVVAVAFVSARSSVRRPSRLRAPLRFFRAFVCPPFPAFAAGERRARRGNTPPPPQGGTPSALDWGGQTETFAKRVDFLPDWCYTTLARRIDVQHCPQSMVKFGRTTRVAGSALRTS